MRNIFLFLVVVIFSGCSNIYSGDGHPVAQKTYEHIKAIPVNVLSYEIKPYSGDFNSNFVANPSDLVHKYLNARFNSNGKNGKLIISVDDVSIKHRMLNSENKAASMLGIARKDHYAINVILVVTLHYDRGTYEIKNSRINAHHNLYISEHLSLAEREEKQGQAIEIMIADIDKAMDQILRSDLGVVN